MRHLAQVWSCAQAKPYAKPELDFAGCLSTINRGRAGP